MAILKVWCDPSRTQSCERTYSPQDNRISTKITETWCVQTDNKNYRPVDILGATDGTTALPKPGTAYTVGAVTPVTAICDHISPTLSHESPLVFECAVSYYVFSLPDSTVKLNLSSVAFPQNCYYDKDNKPVVNTANQSFDPTVTKTFYDLRFTLSYETFVTPPVDAIMAACGKVNSDGVTLSAGGWSRSFTSRQLKVDDARCDFSYQGSLYLWSVSATFCVRVDTFVDKILDQGFAELDDDGNLVAIKDADGNPLNAQALLDGHGKQLDSDADPVYLTFKIENEVSMSGIILQFI